MFPNFPYFFVTILTFCIMQEKNYTFILKIYCFKISPRTIKNVDYFETCLKFKKTLKSGLVFQQLLQNLMERLHSGLILKIIWLPFNLLRIQILSLTELKLR